MVKTELLAPAGSYEKLKLAVGYGADSVYFGGKKFNLRARSQNFSIKDINKAMKYLHNRNKKGYLTLNIFPRNYDLNKIKNYLRKLKDIDLDGIIISNLGVLKLVKKIIPSIDIHISTQANVTDYKSANYWYELGANRIILARELTFDEIKGFSNKAKPEIEIFIHGAMCMAYSGRCLLSKYLTGRDANKGDCAHPCRWKYYIREEKRKDELFEIEEDEEGMYIFNSKDLMLYDFIDKFMNIGIDAFKIEGRIKGILYLTTIVRTYRLLIDALHNNEKPQKRWRENLFEANNRGYHTGFIEGDQKFESNLHSSRTYSNYRLLGYLNEKNIFKAKAPFEVNDKFNYLSPNGKEGIVEIKNIFDLKTNELNEAKPGQDYYVEFNPKIEKFSVLRYER